VTGRGRVRVEKQAVEGILDDLWWRAMTHMEAMGTCVKEI